jgi:hypothetical protein
MSKFISGTSGWKLLAIAVALGGAALAEKDQKTAKTEEAPAPSRWTKPRPGQLSEPRRKRHSTIG